MASTAVHAPELEPWVVSRLQQPGRTLLALDHDWAGVDRARHRITATRALRVDEPGMWLLVVRFANQSDAAAALEPLLAAADRNDQPPYGTKGTVSGAYLLLVGFPSSKPVSPEMERARTQVLSAFAGEE